MAADQGNATAQYNLGRMYGRGEGVPKNIVRAYMWFNLAAVRFAADGADDRAKAERNRDIAAAKMTPAEILEAQRLSREWVPSTDAK